MLVLLVRLILFSVFIFYSCCCCCFGLLLGPEHEIKCRLSADYILIAFQAVAFHCDADDDDAGPEKKETTIAAKAL